MWQLPYESDRVGQYHPLTLPQIETVRLTDDVPSAVQAVTESTPALVLVDASLPDSVSAVLAQVRDNGRRPRYLVLVDDRQQQRDAVAAGADVALLKGFPAAELFEIVERLIRGSSE